MQSFKLGLLGILVISFIYIILTGCQNPSTELGGTPTPSPVVTSPPIPSATPNPVSEFGYVDYGDHIVINNYTGSGGIVTIPSTIIGKPVTVLYGAFINKSNVTSVTVPTSVTTLDSYAFSGASCTSINFQTPSQVTTIGPQSFMGCNSLTSITIPASVTSIGAGAFQSCASLTKILVVSANPSYSSDANGALFDKSGSTLLVVPCALLSYTIPNTVQTIGDHAFAKNLITNLSFAAGSQVETIGVGAFTYSNITSLTLPNSVVSIGASAFYNCVYLTSLTIQRDSPPTLADSTTLQNTSLDAGNHTIHVPSGFLSTYQAAAYWSAHASVMTSP